MLKSHFTPIKRKSFQIPHRTSTHISKSRQKIQKIARHKLSTKFPMPPPPRSDSNLVSFTSGQLSHILQPLQSNYQPRYTTSITTTNPEIASHTQHDNLVSQNYFNPDFDTTKFTIIAQTYALKLSTAGTGKMVPTLQKHDLSSLLKSKTIIDNTNNAFIPHNTPDLYKQGHPVDEIIDTQHRRVLLREDIFPFTLSRDTPYELGIDHTKDELFSRLPQILQEIFTQVNAEIVPQTLTITYPYFSTEQILSALLPKDVIIPTSFTSTGHIAHFNLRAEQIPYQYVIGKVVAEKTNGISTVINKVGMINNVFRNFQAEVLYGESNFITEVKENGYSFVLDFSQVYWNSRLLTEHNRVTQFIHKSWKTQYSNNNEPNYAIDLFGGVGPFVIPLVKAQGKPNSHHSSFSYSPNNVTECFVWGNDINPKSSLYMYKNALKNKVLASQKDFRKHFFEQRRKQNQSTTNSSLEKSSLKVFNSCGRELMQLIAKSQLLDILHSNVIKSKSPSTSPKLSPKLSPNLNAQNNNIQQQNRTKDKPIPFFQHVLMNLPGSAVEFLDMFVGLYSDKSLQFVPEIESAILKVKKTQNDKKTSPTKARSLPVPFTHYLTSHSTISSGDVSNLIKNYDAIQQSILPPPFADRYETLVEQMDINDQNHHWSTLQAMELSLAGNERQPIFSKNSTYSHSNSLYIPSISTTKRSLNLNMAHLPNLSHPTSYTPIQNVQVEKGNELTVHCYCFVRDAIDPYGEALNLVEGYLGFQLAQNRPVNGYHNPKKFKTDQLTTYSNLPAIYDEQIIQLDYHNLPSHIKNSGIIDHDDGSSNKALDVLARQKAYLDTTHFQQYKDNEKMYSPREQYKDKYCSEEGLLLMNYCLKQDHVYVHLVRNVAPQKDMMCVSFIVPDYILFYSPAYQQYLLKIAHDAGGNNYMNDGQHPLIWIDPTFQLLNPVDSIPIDQFDIQLFNQQQYYKNQVTYTTFIQRSIENHSVLGDGKKKELIRPLSDSESSFTSKSIVSHDSDDEIPMFLDPKRTRHQ